MNQKTANRLITLVFIAGIFIYGSMGKTYEEEIENLNINSVVLKKFTDTGNHGTLYLFYKNDSIIISREWDQYIAVGDSVIKPKGSYIMTIRNVNKYVDFDFQNPNQLPPP